MLNSGIGNNKVVENALAKSANSVDTRQRRETSVRHCLELETAISKNVRDTAKCELHNGYFGSFFFRVNGFFSIFSGYSNLIKSAILIDFSLCSV